MKSNKITALSTLIVILLCSLAILILVWINGAHLFRGDLDTASKPNLNTVSGSRDVIEDSKAYNDTVAGLNEGWRLIGVGNSYYQNNKFEEAAAVYEEAMKTDPGNSVFIGLKLIDAYEKSGKRDRALDVLNILSSKQPISEYGQKKYHDIRKRLTS